MDQLALEARAQVLPDLTGRAAQHVRDVLGVVVGQPVGDLLALGVHQRDRLTCREAAADLGHAGRQQRLALADGLDGAVVEHERALDVGQVRQPQQAGVASPAGGQEPGADVLSGQGALDVRGGGHQRGHAAGRGDAGGLDLGHHAAGAHARPAHGADLDALEVLERILDDRDALTALIRVLGVQRVHVREQQQDVGLDQVRGQRRDAVVVAELDLLGGHGVVLIDDRQHAQVQEPLDLAVRVLVVMPLHEVLGGDQDLAHLDVVAGQRVDVPADQQALAHGGGGLLGGQLLGALVEAQRRQTGRDRAGGDVDDLLAALLLLAQRGDDALDRGLVDRVLDAGQRRRADLHDDPLGPGDLRRARDRRDPVLPPVLGADLLDGLLRLPAHAVDVVLVQDLRHACPCPSCAPFAGQV